MTINRMGYGAMQLAGPGVWGPPRDPDAAVAVLREAVAAGVNHIDTSDYYGPHVTNQIIRQALHPYPQELVIVTKVGARRGEDKSWNPDFSRQGLIDAVHDNLRNLGLAALDVVNLRMLGDGHGVSEGSLAEPLTILAELKAQGLIRHLGLSNVTPSAGGGGADYHGDRLRAEPCTTWRIGKMTTSSTISRRRVSRTCRSSHWAGSIHCNRRRSNTVAASLGATPMQVALALVIQRSPNLLLIPGTSSVEHLRENLQAATLQLPADTLATLNAIAAGSEGRT